MKLILMAKQYIPSHILPYDCDIDIPPIERWSLIHLTLNPDGLVTPSMIEDSEFPLSDTEFQDLVKFSRLGHKRWCIFHLVTKSFVHGLELPHKKYDCSETTRLWGSLQTLVGYPA